MHHIPLDCYKAWRVHVQPLSGWTGCSSSLFQEWPLARGFDFFLGIGLLAIVVSRETQLSLAAFLALRGLGARNAARFTFRYRGTVDGQKMEAHSRPAGHLFHIQFLFDAQGTTRKTHRRSSFTSQPDKVYRQYMHVAVSIPSWRILRREDEPGFWHLVSRVQDAR